MRKNGLVPGIRVAVLTFFLLVPAGLRAAPGLRLPPAPEIWARSAVVLDAETGALLFEQNADEAIPPASLTKLVAMQVALRAVTDGRVGLNDKVQLGPESYALNMPRGSSLMFLGPGQRVTVDELLRGLAVPSGNDAAQAMAYHVSGGVSEFVQEMNAEMARLGLSRSSFVEPSGYSPLNITTAREFATFVRHYLLAWPETLARYHSLKEFAYPAAENLVAPHVEHPILQRNRNALLWDYPGVDGLKTGFIPSSGYNIALTGERDGRRLVIVLLGAPGENHAVGGANRSRDGASLLDYGFTQFENVVLGAPGVTGIRVWKGKVPQLSLSAAHSPVITLPRGLQDTLEGELIYPDELEAPVAHGSSIGRAVWRVGETIVAETPLQAEFGIDRAGPLRVLLDTVRLWLRSVGRFFGVLAAGPIRQYLPIS